jgi:hypothetical protein
LKIESQPVTAEGRRSGWQADPTSQRYREARGLFTEAGPLVCWAAGPTGKKVSCFSFFFLSFLY